MIARSSERFPAQGEPANTPNNSASRGLGHEFLRTRGQTDAATRRTCQDGKAAETRHKTTTRAAPDSPTVLFWNIAAGCGQIPTMTRALGPSVGCASRVPGCSV